LHYKNWYISGIIIFAVFIRLVFVFAIPDWWAPDEYPHYYYIEKILLENELPHSIPQFPEYECYQPPLYYIISAIILKMASGKKYNFDRNTLEEPVRSYHQNIVMLRIFSVFLSGLTLIVAFLFLKNIKLNDDFTVFGALAFMAVLPSFISNSVSITNDALANLIGALIILLLVGRRTPGNDIFLGVLLGLGVLTKPNLLVFYPIIIIFLLVKYSASSGVIGSLCVILTISLIIGFPYYFINYRNYGSLIAINPGVSVDLSFEHVNVKSLYSVIRNFFWSFWAAFGRIYEINLNKYFYILYFFPVTILALAGMIKSIFREIKNRTYCLFLWVGVVIIFIAGAFSYSLLYEVNCSWGKYFFPVLPVIALLMIKGIKAVIQEKHFMYVGIFIISLFAVDCKFFIEFLLC